MNLNLAGHSRALKFRLKNWLWAPRREKCPPARVFKTEAEKERRGAGGGQRKGRHWRGHSTRHTRGTLKMAEARFWSGSRSPPHRDGPGSGTCTRADTWAEGPRSPIPAASRVYTSQRVLRPDRRLYPPIFRERRGGKRLCRHPDEPERGPRAGPPTRAPALRCTDWWDPALIRPGTPSADAAGRGCPVLRARLRRGSVTQPRQAQLTSTPRR